ncbi:hypothetical protein J4E91_001419 [Alternaria rosae]|nr:hypothetical protein J4E91_001419 [Alternaria rosae]
MVDWGEGATVDEKVPSVISYSRPNYEWGGALSDDSISMVHTKLELGLQSRLGELDMTLQILDGMSNLNIDEMLSTMCNYDDVPAYSHKSPEEIVTDYLQKVFQHLEMEVDQFGPIARKYTATDLVVTVPTDWSYMAMNSTYRALMKAGFNRTNFPRLQDVMFVTEPEAAAVYTARHYRDELAQTTLQDVVSYQVKRLEPALELEPIGSPTGDKCGSIFINMKFKKWLRKILTDVHYKELDPNFEIDKTATHASETPAMRSLMKDFDLKKKHFTAGSSGCKLELPPPLENLIIQGRVNQGLLTIKRHEMESFFDASIEQIVILIKDHIKRIREQRRNRPKNLFLVGGYGESEYLQAQIQEMLLHERLIMQYWRPQKSWTAVVRGAVVCGIEKNFTKSLKRTDSCRNSYAICLDESYTSTYHGNQEEIIEHGGGTFAKGQLTWLLNKGDLVLLNESTKRSKTIHIRLSKQRQDMMALKIWQYMSDERYRPTRLEDATDELRNAGELGIDLSKIQFDRVRQRLGKPTYFTADLELVLDLEWDKLRATLWWKQTELTSISVLY